MLVEKRLNSRHTQAGLTLVELMISIVLGLLLLGAATAMTVSSLVMNGDTLKSARLNQDLDSVLQVMVNDIRRAGYSANFDKEQPGVDFAAIDYDDLNIDSLSCVLYAYNSNGDNTLSSDEKFGFKWEGEGFPIEMRTSCTGGTCDASCDAGTWVALTDSAVINITSLTFNSVNSKCFNFSDSENPNQNAYWVTSGEDTIDFPCMIEDKDVLVNYASDVNGDFPVEGEIGTVSDPLDGDKLIESRQVNVRITGSLLGNDSSMRKDQSVAINVRNNSITVTP